MAVALRRLPSVAVREARRLYTPYKYGKELTLTHDNTAAILAIVIGGPGPYSIDRLLFGKTNEEFRLMGNRSPMA